MAKLVLFGATGYAGSRLRAEALARGHQVVGVARNPADADTVTGSLFDETRVRELVADADVLISAIPFRPAEDGTRLADVVPMLAKVAAETGTRLGFVGGAGSLRVAEDGPRLIDTPAVPDEYREESRAAADALDALRSVPSDVDWFYLSPAAGFGAHAPGERTGRYRVGGEVLLTDEHGASDISGADYAIAFLDEIERPAHRGQRFSVAY